MYTLRLLIYFTLVFLFISGCSQPKKVYVQSDLLQVNNLIEKDTSIQALILPYKDSLREEMSRVISYASDDFTANRPEGSLGNFMVDFTLDYVVNSPFYDPLNQYVCIMNQGGLRAPINKGEVKVEDIYKLMPFDNTIVLLKTSKATMDSIHKYINNSGGEPIAGFKIDRDNIYLTSDEKLKDTITIITSNYLASGGDNMSFLKHAYSQTKTGILLRDLLIEKVEAKDTIHPVIDQRIKLN